MTTINLLPIAREYKNNGQHAEQVARYPLTGEIKQMYLNAYYGKKHFEEKPMPTEADIAEDDSAHNFKQAYRRAENGKNKA